MARMLLVLAAATAVVLAALPDALAQDRVRARIERPHRCPAAGHTVMATWTLTAVRNGRRVPYRASGVYVKIVRRDGRPALKRFARSTRRGHYRARLTAPKGGIRRLEIWRARVRHTPGGKTTPADVRFPVRGDPCRR
jgi:hypothetical protein